MDHSIRLEKLGEKELCIEDVKKVFDEIITEDLDCCVATNEEDKDIEGNFKISLVIKGDSVFLSAIIQELFIVILKSEPGVAFTTVAKINEMYKDIINDLIISSTIGKENLN